MEATKCNALGIASTKDMTSFKIGAKMCSVTFRAKTNVPKSFPVTRTNTKGKNNCIISNQRPSNLSNHQRNDDPQTKINERFRFAAFFWARRSSLLGLLDLCVDWSLGPLSGLVMRSILDSFICDSAHLTFSWRYTSEGTCNIMASGRNKTCTSSALDVWARQPATSSFYALQTTVKD